MSRKSKVEVSPHFNEILTMIKEGLSSRDISDYLKNEYGEKIAHGTINTYAKKIRSKTNQEYYKKKKQREVVDEGVANKEAVDEVVAKGVSDLDALDNIISEANDLNLGLDKLKPEKHTEYVVTTEADIAKLKIQAKRLGIQAVNAKSKILKDSDGEDSEIKINIVGFDDGKTNNSDPNQQTERKHQ